MPTDRLRRRLGNAAARLAAAAAVGAWLFGLLFPAYPHAGDPERPVRELFWVGVALAPAIGLALAGIRHGDAAARPAAWCALGLLVVLLLLVAGGLLRVITG